MRRDWTDNDEAVSPVIATVLLMAITVLLASAVYLLVDDAITTPDKGEPYAKMSVRALDMGTKWFVSRTFHKTCTRPESALL